MVGLRWSLHKETFLSSPNVLKSCILLEWVAMLSSRGSSRPRNQTWVFYVSCIGRQFLYPLMPCGEPTTFILQEMQIWKGIWITSRNSQTPLSGCLLWTLNPGSCPILWPCSLSGSTHHPGSEIRQDAVLLNQPLPSPGMLLGLNHPPAPSSARTDVSFRVATAQGPSGGDTKNGLRS